MLIVSIRPRHPAQERERLVQDLNGKMNQIASHLDEIRNLRTQYDMLVKANAATRIRLSVRFIVTPTHNVLG